MSKVEELKRIREFAKTLGGRPSGQKGSYLEFVEEQAAREEAQIQAIVSEQNETLRKIAQEERLIAVREERRRMQKEETPEVYATIPQVSAADINLTPEQVTQKIAEAVKLFRSRIEISKADWTLLCNFLEQNSIDATDVAVWERALQFIIDRLTLLESGGPLPEPPAPPPPPDPADVNPYPYNDSIRSAYAMWERDHSNKQLWKEQVVPVREWLTEVVTHDDKDLSAENIEALMKVMRAKNIPFTRETVRRQFLDLWGVEMSESARREAFTREELSAWETDREDSRLSADQLKAKYRSKVGF